MSDIDIEYKIVNEIKDELAFPPAQTSVIVEYLNRHGWLRDPAQAPGRTITRSEFNKAFSEWFDERDKARIVGIVERLFGITVIPDAEPTNAENLADYVRQMDLTPMSPKECGKWLDEQGVKAPGVGDEHPEQVPGRTITESEFHETADAHRNGGLGWEDLARRFGITVIPDPEPTNAELIERKLRELREEPGEWMTYATDSDICGFARALDAKGVKAPGGDDE